MLSLEQLQSLNRQMIGEGEPVERDEVGYNKVHFWRMRSLSHIEASHLTDLMAFAIADTLSFYWNTQLSEYKDELKETMTALRDSLGESANIYIGNKSYFKNAIDPEIEKNRLFVKVDDATDTTLFLSCWSLNDAVLAYIADDKTIQKSLFGGYELPWESVKGFYDILSHHGYWNRDLEALLQDFDNLKSNFVEKYSSTNKEEKERVRERYHIQIVNADEKHLTLHYEGFVGEVRAFVRSKLSDDARWEKETTTAGNAIWNIRVSWKALPELYALLQKQHYWNDDLDEIIESPEIYRANMQDKFEMERQAYYELHPLEITSFSANEPDFVAIRFGNTLDRACFDAIQSYSQQNGINLSHKFYESHTGVKATVPYTGVGEFNAFIHTLPCKNLILSQSYEALMNDFTAKNKEYRLIDVSNLNLKFMPYPYQIEDAKRLLATKRMLNSNEMGCGKTFEQVIVGESIDTPKLVICPATLRLNWMREIQNVNPDADIVILGKEKRGEEPRIGKNWTIVSYDGTGKYGNLLESANFNVVMVDEAHFCKAIDSYGNPSSKRAKNVLNFCSRAMYVYPITGTPTPSRNKDVFNLLRMIQHPLTQDQWGFFKFGQTYCDGHNDGYGWDFSGNSNTEELNGILSEVMVRHLKSEVLPDLKKQRTFLPLDVNIKKYEAAMKACAESMDDPKDINSFLAYAMTGRRILSEIKVKDVIAYAKTLLQEDEPVVIVSNFKDTVAAVKDAFGDNCSVIEGGMTDAAKQKSIDDFQSGKVKVCAMNIIAGGVGVTLTAAHNMIICDFDWTPSNLSQAEDRICRAGQEKPCNIIYMYAEGADIDEYFVHMLSDKAETIDKVVDNSKGDSMNLVATLAQGIYEKYHKATEPDQQEKKERRRRSVHR